jgi:hypothetical protein
LVSAAANIKAELGKLRPDIDGNVIRTEIAISIRSYFYLGGFEMTPDNLEGRLQTKLPVWLFGLSDYYSGFTRAERIVPPLLRDIQLNAILLFQRWIRRPRVLGQFNSAIYGYNCYNQYLGIPAGNRNPLSVGDMYFWFSAELPTFLSGRLALITVHSPDVAYGTFLNSFVSDLITIDRIKIIVPLEGIAGAIPPDQFKNPLIFVYQDLFGVTITDTVDPRMFITSRDMQQQICDIPLELPLDKNLMLGFYLDVLCTSMDIVLYVSKVESLTYKLN